MKQFRSIVIAALTVAFVGMAAPRSEAGPIITLTDQNATATIDVNSASGMTSWVVDGINHLYQQWFWFRYSTPSSTAYAGDEFAINALGAAVNGAGGPVTPVDLNSDGDDDVVFIRHQNTDLRVDVRYSLVGNAPGTEHSIIGEEIKLWNLSGQVMNLAFFQYSDFHLGETPNNDSVALTGTAAHQSDGIENYLSEVVGFGVNSAPAAYEGASGTETLSKFGDGDVDNLSNSPSAGPGDVTWAFQWNFVLQPGNTVSFSKQKSIGVPEPASLVLFGLGLIGAAGFARRRKQHLGQPQV